jgi:prepilin-type N-terminal cleavage/methylation domain-containing protein
MSKKEGFTLIEIIVTITISAVLAAFFVQYMGSAFMGSGKSVNTLKETYAINQVIAKVTAGYRNELDNGTLNLSDFKDNLSTTFDENSVTCSGMFLNYRSAGNLIDTNSDGIIEPVEETPGPTKFLLVTASKSNRSMRVLLTEE